MADEELVDTSVLTALDFETLPSSILRENPALVKVGSARMLLPLGSVTLAPVWRATGQVLWGLGDDCWKEVFNLEF